MSTIKLRWIYLLLAAVPLLIVGAAPSPPMASSVTITGDGDRDPIFACRESQPFDCRDKGASADGVVTGFAHYVEQVLANEWDPRADAEALKAGAVAVRTFTDRNPGCGARLPYNWNPWPGYVLGILHNRAQAYWIKDGSSWRQNTVTSAHQSARSATDGVRLLQLYLGDWEAACAKYKANCGDPTLALINEGTTADRNTLQSVPDPVAQHYGVEVDTGMAQNGTVAWERGSAPWDYRQMLTHYYIEVRLAGSSDYYRWTWLNTRPPEPGEEFLNYHVSTNPSPEVIYLEDPRERQIQIGIQNTARETWNVGDVTLSYRWYTTSGGFINQGPEFDTRSTTTFDPSETEWVTANLNLPDGASSGTCYILKWDLKRGSTWFSSQNNWPTLDSTVCVQADTDPPDNPPSGSVSSSSGHVLNGWVTSTQIVLDWWGASDDETGVGGYSVAWDQISNTVPDTSQDTSESNVTSGVLGHGNWYLHVRTRDNAGNWAGSATHYGPYGIDAIAPTSQVTGSVSTDPTKSWFYVDVSGSDEGSGVTSYAVQYKIDTGSWQDYRSVSGPGPHTVLFFPSRYNPGHTYHFRSQATDAVGLIESSGEADWSVYIPQGADPTGLVDLFCPLMTKNHSAQ